MSQTNVDRDNQSESLERAVDESEIPLEASRTLENEREAAQGVEVFEDPDATVPRSTLRQGAPGHETLVGDFPADDEDRDEELDERW